MALQGTVIFVDPRGSVLIQDTDGGDVLSRLKRAGAAGGDEVGVRGIPSPGMYGLPGIQKPPTRSWGMETPPAAPVSYADLLSGRYHCNRRWRKASCSP